MPGRGGAIELWVAGLYPEKVQQDDPHAQDLAVELSQYIPGIPFILKTYFLQEEQGSHDYAFLLVPDRMDYAMYVISKLDRLYLPSHRATLKADFSKDQ